MPAVFVLDTSALLAVAFHEPGGERVKEAGAESLVSTVNSSEVWAKLVDRDVPEAELRVVFAEMEMNQVPFDPVQAEIAGRLRKNTRRFGLSLGDRACLALAIARKMPVLTADRAWADLNLGVEIEVIR